MEKKLLDEQSNFLCVGEQVWCTEENKLYIKIKAKSGNIVLLPIGGVTESAVSTKFSYDNGMLNIETTDGSIRVDSDGYLVLDNCKVDENGILILDNKN